ncbi:MlaD family protein [Mycolicibacterium aichiense]|uniref:MlaD family protein n=1 Tax=Mycolicibacterium aichiense TaxID=1799 RepID=UPI003D6779D4
MKRIIAVLVVAVGATACSSNGLSSLPLPAPTVGSGGYRLTAVFANALNLPAEAKVKLAGADVGQMETIVARNYTAVTTIRIMDGVRLPQGSTAELRSATPLGDVFIALKPPPGASAATPLLKDGNTIGLDSTTAAATVESVLSSAAVMVNGGAVRNLTNVINGLGKATGDQGQAFGDIIAKTNGTLAKLTARSGQIADALTETSQLARELDAKNQALSEVMIAAGPATDTLVANADTVADVVQQAGDASKQLEKFPSIAGTDTSGRSVIGDANTIARSWNDLVLAPDANLAALNRLMPPIIKATASNSFSVRASIDRLVLGSMPDAGFLGDPGFHGPKRYDWAQMVGSFKYTLWRLQQRVVGSGPGVPQVPVLPSPTDPGGVIVAPPGPLPGPPASEPPP